ncbi:MAG: hypothetical protein J6P03_03455 [Opitutales bacterium]|nr:hypothetical protein [Opitutales bacterium]
MILRFAALAGAADCVDAYSLRDLITMAEAREMAAWDRAGLIVCALTGKKSPAIFNPWRRANVPAPAPLSGAQATAAIRAFAKFCGAKNA